MTMLEPRTSTDIEWRERPGDGAVLVCLHGIGSMASTFEEVVGHLPSDLRVICWNAPGYGQSRPLDIAWPLAADYADALARLCDGLDLQQVHVMGHSLGTLIGAAFAVRHRDRTGSLTLASCAQGRGVARNGTLSEQDARRLDDLVALGAERFARERAPRLLFEPEANPELVAAVERDMAQVTLPGYGQAVRMLASGNLSDDCARIAVPTSVIVGAADVVTPPEQSQAAFDALDPSVRGSFTKVAGAGHALHRQAPQALAATIVATLSDIGNAMPATGTLQAGESR